MAPRYRIRTTPINPPPSSPGAEVVQGGSEGVPGGGQTPKTAPPETEYSHSPTIEQVATESAPPEISKPDFSERAGLSASEWARTFELVRFGERALRAAGAGGGERDKPGWRKTAREVRRDQRLSRVHGAVAVLSAAALAAAGVDFPSAADARGGSVASDAPAVDAVSEVRERAAATPDEPAVDALVAPSEKAPAVSLTDEQLAASLRQRAAEAKAQLHDLCRNDINAFNEYVLRDDETGGAIEQSPFHLQAQAALTDHKRVVVMSHPESGKALALDTEIPTPRGWTTMGELCVGDRVFGSDGKPCSVTFATGVQLGRRVFEVEFEDGAVLKADADHRWLVRKRQAAGTRVVTTLEMLQRLVETDGHYVWSVPCTKAVEYEDEALLPVPAYVLGAWLGDGTSENSGITFHAQDEFVWKTCVGYVGGHAPRADKRFPSVMTGTLGAVRGSVRGRLRRLGVIANKHIPVEYLTASVADRRALLAGLLDTDGSVSRAAGGSSRVELTLCNERLAHDALELIRSLGFRATIAESDACLKSEVVGRRWRICFTAREPVFRLPRKLAKQQLGGSERSRWKHIVAIREIASVPVRCISVDNADRTYLAGRAYTVTHNTSQIAIGRVLWELGRNPNLRVMLLYNAEDSAAKTLGAIKRYIESSKELHAVFPNLRRGSVWKDDQIFVQRTAYDRNPSIVAVGYNSRRIGGSRVDLLIVDDLLDAVVTATEAQRRKLSSWVKNTVFTRLTRTALVAFLTNAWHPRDLAHELVRERGWFSLKRPIRNTDGSISWGRWTEARLKLVRKELGPLEYARAFECNPRDDEARVFRPEHVEAALAKGKGYSFLRGLSRMPDNCLIVTGVDLAAGDDAKTKGARTVLSSVFFHPNQDRQLVRLKSGRWRARQILDNVAAVGALYPRNHWVVVENNGVQQYILDLAHENHVEVGVALVPFTTGRNKADPRFGVASMSAEFEATRWILPSDCDEDEQEEVEGLVSDLIDYVPEAHTGDKLMATWMAREIGRKIFARFYGSGRRYEGSSVRAIG